MLKGQEGSVGERSSQAWDGLALLIRLAFFRAPRTLLREMAMISSAPIAATWKKPASWKALESEPTGPRSGRTHPPT